MTWIPVTDRLPDLDVPVWAVHRVGTSIHHSMLVRVDIGYVERDHTEWVWCQCYATPYVADDGAWSADSEQDDDYDVIAWQPLPVPYRDGA